MRDRGVHRLIYACYAPSVSTAWAQADPPVGLALIHFDLASARLLPAITLMGKLAMADIFLIALYIVLAKGVGVGRLETGWGLYAFTGCVLVSLACSYLTKPKQDPTP